MSKEGHRQHIEFLEGYLERESVKEDLDWQEKNRFKKLESTHLGGVRVFGTFSTEILLRVGRALDKVGIIMEAQAHAAHKGYKFK